MEKHVKDRLKTKSKIEKEVETVKPTVINDDLIESYMVSYNKENKIFDRPDMRIWDLSHLALSYKNIVEIDNLRGLENLTKLQLDNNIIVKIQNLDNLVNLQWLDLSFNLITEIEGLDRCWQLTDLSLYKNKIKNLGGLDQL